jgi:hypothetical protein
VYLWQFVVARNAAIARFFVPFWRGGWAGGSRGYNCTRARPVCVHAGAELWCRAKLQLVRMRESWRLFGAPPQAAVCVRLPEHRPLALSPLLF